MRTTMLAALLTLPTLGACTKAVDCAGEPLEELEKSNLFLNPPAGQAEGPVNLVIGNGTRHTISCEMTESDSCPSLAAYQVGLEEIGAGACWRVERVHCADLELSCFSEDGEQIATWSWAVTSP